MQTSDGVPISLRYVLDRLGIEVSMGHHHAVIGAELEKAFTSAAWEAAPEFFGFTLAAYFAAALLGLTRVVDARSDTVNLETMAEFVDREAGCFVESGAAEVRASLLPRIRKELQQLRADVEPLKKRRDQQYAHAALRRTLTDTEWAITWSEMEHAYERAIVLVNSVAKAFQGEKAMIMRGAQRETVRREIAAIIEGFDLRRAAAAGIAEEGSQE